MGSQLSLKQAPGFRTATATLEEWNGCRIAVQFDTAYLHRLPGPYWLRVEICRPGQTHCVVRTLDGDLSIRQGGAHETPAYSADLGFATDAAMERLLGQVADLLSAWKPDGD